MLHFLQKHLFTSGALSHIHYDQHPEYTFLGDFSALLVQLLSQDGGDCAHQLRGLDKEVHSQECFILLDFVQVFNLDDFFLHIFNVVTKTPHILGNNMI